MTSPAFTRADYQTAADVIRSRTAHRPTVAIILGSGLGGLADAIESANVIPTSEIPRWPRSTVVGHAGKLVIGKLEGQDVLVLQGRTHFYEGYSIHEATFPVLVICTLGIQALMVPNAADRFDEAYPAH